MISKILTTQIERFSKSPFFKNVVLLAGGTAAAQAISLLTAPIITRLYTPADFGVLTVFAAVLGIIGQLSTLRYSVTIPLAEDEDLAYNVLKLCFLITLSLSFLFEAGVLLFGDYFATRFSAAPAAQYLWLLPVCLLGAGLYEALSSWAVRRKYFKVIAQTKLSQGLSSSGIKIGLGWLGIKPLGLLLGLLASQVAGTGSILLKLLKEKPRFFSSISWIGIGYAAQKFSRFPLFQSWSRLLLSLGAQLPAIFMAAFYGVEVAGLFGLANGMVKMPMNLLGTSVAQVYYAEIAKYGKSRPDKILKLSLSIVKKMFLVGFIPMGAIVIAGPLIFSLVFGAQWYDSGVYARWLSIPILMKFISSPIAHCFDVLEMQGLQIIINVIRVLLILIIFITCRFINLSPLDTVTMYSILYAIFPIFLIAIIFFILKRGQRSCYLKK